MNTNSTLRVASMSILSRDPPFRNTTTNPAETDPIFEQNDGCKEWGNGVNRSNSGHLFSGGRPRFFFFFLRINPCFVFLLGAARALSVFSGWRVSGGGRAWGLRVHGAAVCSGSRREGAAAPEAAGNRGRRAAGQGERPAGSKRSMAGALFFFGLFPLGNSFFLCQVLIGTKIIGCFCFFQGKLKCTCFLSTYCSFPSIGLEPGGLVVWWRGFPFSPLPNPKPTKKTTN